MAVNSVKLLILWITSLICFYSIYTTFSHFSLNDSVPKGYTTDSLYTINYELFFTSLYSGLKIPLVALIIETFGHPSDRWFVFFTEVCIREASITLLDLRIRQIGETNLSSRLSVFLGDTIAILIFAWHTFYRQKIVMSSYRSSNQPQIAQLDEQINGHEGLVWRLGNLEAKLRDTPTQS